MTQAGISAWEDCIMKRWIPVCVAAVLEAVLLFVVFGSGLQDTTVLRTLWVLIGINLLLVIIPLTVRAARPDKSIAPSIEPATVTVKEKDPQLLYKKGVRMLSNEFISKEDHRAASRMIIAAARGGCREAVDYLNNLSPEEQAKIQP
jgi:hypothetical protein